MEWRNCVFTDAQGNFAASLSCLPALFSNVLNVLFMFAGTVAAIIIIVSGIRMILSGGDAKQLETAQKTLLYAVAGLFIIFFSYFIISIIAYVTGVNCILTIGPWDTNSCAHTNVSTKSH